MSLAINYKNKKNGDIGYQRFLDSIYADEAGDGTGNFEVTGNYLTTPKEFFFQPAPGRIFRMSRLIIYIEDAGNMDSGFYGNNLVLVNGIKFFVKRNGVQRFSTMMQQAPVKTNGDIAAICHDLEYRNWGAGNTFLTARWTLTKMGQFVRLVGDKGDNVGLIFNDDFTGLVKHRFCIQGFYE
jgi:hypothetical protein